MLKWGDAENCWKIDINCFRVVDFDDAWGSGSAARYFDRIFAHTGSSSIIAGSSRVIDSSRGFKGGEFLRKIHTSSRRAWVEKKNNGEVAEEMCRFE